LFDYSTVPVILLALGCLEWILLALEHFRPIAPKVAVAALVLSFCLLLIPSASGPRSEVIAERGEKTVNVLNWVRAHLPCQARILSNQRTVGVFKVMTGRVAVLEGMTPFLRPRMLQNIIDLLLRARRFFSAPVSKKEFLKRTGVEYVVQVHGLKIGHGYGAIDQPLFAPFLKLVHQGRWVRVYRVVGLSRERSAALSASAPGYICRRDPVSI
jgi:hypothetical protein